jgi:flagellar hook assembly protein FlgD
VVPAGISLGANYPNPFNPATTLSYELSRPAKVHLSVFDGRGRRVRVIDAGFVQAGRYESRWDGMNDAGLPMPSGTFFARAGRTTPAQGPACEVRTIVGYEIGEQRGKELTLESFRSDEQVGL